MKSLDLSKKGQMEIVGLVIIVILLSLGMLFMAIFALQSEGDKSILTSKGLAASTMAALMKTTINECETPVALEKDLLDDCAQNYGFPSQGYTCSGKNSCEFLDEKIGLFLSDTLGKWGKNYQFESVIVSNEKTLISVKGKSGCSKKQDRDTSGPFYLTAESGELVRSELFIC